MKVGGREIIASGSVVTNPGDGRIEIQHAALVFELNFLSGDGEARIAGRVDGERLVLDLVNFTNALPTGWQSEVGALRGHPLHLALMVVTVGGGDRLQRAVQYTLSLGAA